MTLKEIEDSTKEILSADDVREVLGCQPQALRNQAKRKPESLGFPVVIIGDTLKIPRRGFLHFIKYGRAQLPNTQEEKEATL